MARKAKAPNLERVVPESAGQGITRSAHPANACWLFVGLNSRPPREMPLGYMRPARITRTQPHENRHACHVLGVAAPAGMAPSDMPRYGRDDRCAVGFVHRSVRRRIVFQLVFVWGAQRRRCGLLGREFQHCAGPVDGQRASLPDAGGVRWRSAAAHSRASREGRGEKSWPSRTRRLRRRCCCPTPLASRHALPATPQRP